MSLEEQQVIILLGPPGSGKGTQAKQITRALDIPHISTGDLFRENMSQNTELGLKAKTYINNGRLVPDGFVLELLFDRVSRSDCHNGYLLDGFPRTIAQAEAFDCSLAENAVLHVISLYASDEVVVKRISGRLTCSRCGHIHNQLHKICEKCGGKLIQREDDRKEVVYERLRVYQEETAPLVAYYKSKGTLHIINGEQEPDQVFKEVMALLG